MKVTLYFLAGVVVGSAATFLAVKGYFEKEAETRIQEEVDSVKASYQKMSVAKDLACKNREKKAEMMANGGVSEDSSESVNDIHVDDADRATDWNFVKKEDVAGRSEEKDEASEKQIVRDIHRIRRSYSRNVFDDYGTDSFDSGNWQKFEEEESEEVGVGGPREELADEPYVITADEWNNERREFDKCTIFYYEDDVAVDEQERVIDDIDQLIGTKNVSRLGDLADNDGAVLIRNEMRSTDYEILLQEGTYIPDSIPVRD